MVIQYVVDSMGCDIYLVLDSKKTKLADTLCNIKKELLPIASIQTMRRWIYHYLLYGETPEETKAWRKKTWRRSNRHNNLKKNEYWDTDDLKYLKSIVDDKPYLFLDEIQDKLQKYRGKRFLAKEIWKKLTINFNYSLKVAFEKALQKNEEERKAYLMTRQQLLKNLEMAIFIDETQKGQQAARRQRLWTKRGQNAFYHALSWVLVTCMAL